MATPSGPIRKQLGPAKQRLTQRIKEASALIANNDVAQLKGIRSKLKANIVYFNELIEKLRDVQTSSDDEQIIIEDELERCTEIQMDASECMDELNELVDHAKGDDKTTALLKLKETEKLERELENLKLEGDLKRAQLASMNESKDAGATNALVATHAKKRVKLPTIELPEFGGNILDWTAFWDFFSSTVHNNTEIPKVEKFKYLKSCLRSEAKDAAAGFSSTDAQYDELIEHLKERYDDKPYIVSSHYSTLAKIKQSTNETTELRRTFNHIETHLRSLSSLGEVIENNYLICQIKAKLPEELNLKLEELRTEDEWTTASLRKHINKLITARERSEEISVSGNGDLPLQQYSGEGLLTREVNMKCIFCAGPHWSDECQRYKTVTERKEKIRGRCFVCLGNNHFFRECTVQKPCYHCKRKGNHHSSLCPVKFSSVDDSNGGNDNDREPGITTLEVELSRSEVLLSSGDNVVMKTAVIRLKNGINGREVTVNALFDTGAKRTYILSEKARRLNLKISSGKPVHLNTFGTKESRELNVSLTEFIIKRKDGSEMVIKNAKVVETITGPMVRQEINAEKYEHIWKNLDMAKMPSARFTIDVLIGNDYYDDILTAEKIKVDEGLYLMNTTVGWMFSGRITGQTRATDEVELAMISQEDEIKQFWDLESIGIDCTTQCEEEQRAMAQFNAGVKLINNRYQVPWLWKVSRYELSSNYNLCETRLKSFYSTKKDSDIELYDAIIKNQIASGYVEDADNSKAYKEKSEVVLHYLPHHMVNSAGKSRIVYEGCAKAHRSQKSLNDCLYPGRNMVANLCGMLIRFRIPKLVLLADIEKAYLQLDLCNADRDTTRFLWLKDIKKPPSRENIRELRFTRVIWGIICSAFLLAATIIHHLSKIDTPIARQIARDLYIDNLVTGVTTVKEAIEFYKETKKIFCSASMNMRQWLSNSTDVMAQIDEADRNEKTVEKVLGMLWNVQSDTLFYPSLKELRKADLLTKRVMLKCTHGIFDPPGLIAPTLLKPKLLIQNCWKKKVMWDDKVPMEIEREWNQWISEMTTLKNLAIKRGIDQSSGSNVQYELMIFTDASKHAYAVAVYLRVSNGHEIDSNLIFSKTRLSPTKEMTIPRLELLGVLIGCRTSKFLVKQLGVDVKQLLFTDSICVIECNRAFHAR